MLTPEVQQLLDHHRSLTYDEQTHKIRCSLTNHEMPAKVDAIENYVKGKKYKRLADLEALSYEDHKMHIVPSSKKENEMFCRLTLRHLEKTSKAIERHISGRKYKNSLARWNECKKTGQKFIAHIRRKAKGPDESDSDSMAGDESIVEDESDNTNKEDIDDDQDDMSDLYPEADFQEEVDSNDDEVSMEVDDSTPTENVPPRTSKSVKPKKMKEKKDGKKKNKGAGKVKKGKSNVKKRSLEQNDKEAVVKKKIKS